MEGCHDGGSDGCDGGGVTVVMAAMVWVIGSLLESARVQWSPVESTGLAVGGLRWSLPESAGVQPDYVGER